MSNAEKHYPIESNIGENCMYWIVDVIASRCGYPKYELDGRTTCGGVIDDVCLNIKDGRTPSDFSQLLLMGIRTSFHDGTLLPPGNISES